MIITTRTGTVITIDEAEEPEIVHTEALDVIEYAQAIKKFCAEDGGCKTCPFRRDGGTVSVCSLIDSVAPADWRL